ncbi:tetratricopeptide repeat protein [Streptomyces sp. yr375]|uniref:tetratricopeptide repeat protein n=1 Tax=Streptomyces sp. yr375 TaxID=1761906 RepID=UPI0011603F41|nr:tetratricopeptide repeat protein [Streptomyces sp. yr375]
MSNLLRAPAVFTGRDTEAGRLLDALDPATEHTAVGVGVGVVAVAGLGGVGKTALALHVAHTARQRGWFPGGALFVDLRGYDDVPATSEHAVLSLLRALGGDEPGGEDLYGRYRIELARRAPVLIVLDNVSDPAQITPLLPGEGAGHRVLITSRDVQDSLPVRQFTIGALATEDACLLVDRCLREHDPDDLRATEDPDAVRELASLCGHLPLALLIAAALLRRRGPRPVSTLTAELRTAADRVRALRFKGVDQYRRELALRPVFDVMYGRLEPEVARVLRALGQAPTPEVWMGSAVVLADLSLDELRPLLDDLVAASLLTADPGGELWRMHDLVQVYVRGVADADPRTAQEAETARGRLLDICETGLRAANNCLWPGAHPDTPDSFTGDYQRALNWLDAERQTLLGLARRMDTTEPTTPHTDPHTTAAQPPPPPRTAQAMALGLNLDAYLHLRRAHHDWLEVATAAHRTAQRLGDTAATAAACGSLGMCLNALGRGEEAVPLLYRATELCAETRNQRAEAAAWTNLGTVLRGLGRPAEAVRAHRGSLRLYEALGDRRSKGLALGNYGATLYALGRYDDSLAATRKALRIHLELGDKSGEAAARSFLGHLWTTAGRTAEAADEYLRSARLYTALDNPHETATACLHMARALHTLGHPAQAEEILRIAAACFEYAGSQEEAAKARRLAEGQ